jgi:low temperature requirement protein LtrA
MSTSLRSVVDTLTRPVAVYERDAEGPRHATWLELFFDLVFIVAVAELGRLLREGLTVVGIMEYASLFLLVWWTWLGFSYYADLFHTEDLLSQFAMIAVMFGVIVLSQTIPDAAHGRSFGFAATYLVLRLFYIALTIRAWYVVSDARRFLTYWVTFSAVATAFWAMSLVTPEPGRFGLWISFFLLDLAGLGVVYLVFESIPVQLSHFPERLGLFTILVLGESILAVAIGVEGTDWIVRSGLTALGGFLVAVLVWWLYFSKFDERTIDQVLAGPANGNRYLRERMLVYMFGHYLVYAGIGMSGVGLETAIEAAVEGHAIHPVGRTVLAGGIAAFLVGSAVSHRAMPVPLHERLFVARLLTAVAVVLGAIVGGEVPPVFVTWLIAGLLVGLGVFEGVHEREEPRRRSQGGPDDP